MKKGEDLVDYQFPEFVFFRPIFTAFILILLVVLLVVIFQKGRLLNLFSVMSILLICTYIPAMLLIAEGYIVDEYNLGGDAITMYQFFGIVGLATITIFVFLGRRKK